MKIFMRTIVAALTLLGWSMAAVGVAHASPGYGLVESFGEAQLQRPLGVAVDPVNGDVYVSSFFSEDRLHKFSASGSPLSPPSPFGEEKGLSALSAFKAPTGMAVDPTNEALYAIDGLAEAIQTYSGASGALLSHFSVAGSANLTVSEPLTAVQIASDATGNVYFPNAPNNEVQVFNPTGTPLRTITGSGASALKEPTGVAVNAEGDVYVADDGNGRIEELSPAGVLLGSIASPGVQALALGPSGEVFAGVLNEEDLCEPLSPPCFHVVVYSPAGAKLADFGAGTIGSSSFGAINTLAVGPSGVVYVADAANNVVRVYAHQHQPSLQSVSSVAVEQSTATLKATIDPGYADTTYRFEYGTSTAYGTSTPVPDRDIGSGLEGPVPAAQELSGLQPGTTYHYRVVATNALGVIASADQTFTTQPALPPAVGTGPAVSVTQNAATLTATIETQGFETTYELDLGTDTGYGTRIFGDAGPEPGVQTYEVALQGLQPGTTYHYRIAATNTFGTSYGTDQAFTTSSYPASTLTTPVVLPLVPAPLLATASTTNAAHTASVQAAARTARHDKTGRRRGVHRRKGGHGMAGGNNRRGR
jgi:NHL repeat-containing protein